MRKKVLFILLLILLDVLSLYYLFNIKVNEPYSYQNKHKPIIVLQQDLELYSIDNFDFSSYFNIFSFNDYTLNYHFTDEKLIVNIKTNLQEYAYEYSYHIIEPIVIEKEVIKEVYIDKPIQDEITIEDVEEEDSYIEQDNEDIIFDGYHDLTFDIGTDISTVINALTKDIITNVQVSIDYSSLNTSVEGCYPVYYYYSDMSQMINIYIK